MKLHLQSKKLDSGRYQVRFATDGSASGFYGYLLAEPNTPITKVVERIERHVRGMGDAERFLQRNLFSFGTRCQDTDRVLIFKK